MSIGPLVRGALAEAAARESEQYNAGGVGVYAQPTGIAAPNRAYSTEVSPADALAIAQKTREQNQRTHLRKVGPRPYYTGTPVFIDGRPQPAGTALPRGVEQSPYYSSTSAADTRAQETSPRYTGIGGFYLPPDAAERIREFQARGEEEAEQRRQTRLNELVRSSEDPYRYGRDPNTPEGPPGGLAPRAPRTRRYGHGKRFEFKKKPGKAEGGMMQAETMKAPEGGLSQMMAEQGAPDDLLEEIDRIESIPGGRELLFTIAGQEMMESQGASKEQAKKLRLFNMGGAVGEEGYAKGGLAESGLTTMAETVREGGRGDDEILLHMSPEEFEAITAMWGQPDKNPVTGLPEYGFLSKVWKKIKKGVKKVVKSKWFQVLAPIALSIFVPGIGTAIGSALTGGGTGLAASAVGNAVVNGALGAASGGKEGFIKGALSGAIGAGGLGKAAGQAAGLSGAAADVAGSAVLSGAASAAQGDGFGEGALSGGLGAAGRGVTDNIVKGTQSKLGIEQQPGKVFAQKVGSGSTTLNPVTGEPIAVGDDPGLLAQRQSGITQDSDPSEIGLAEASPTGSAATGDPTQTAATGAEGSNQKLLDTAVKYGIPLATAFGGAGQGGGEGPPPDFWDNGNTDEALPDFALNRGQRQNPTDYFTYGQRTGPQGGREQDFFAGNNSGAPGDGTAQQPRSAATVDPATAAQLQAAGWTLQGNMWYPPGGGSTAPSAGVQPQAAAPQYNIDPYAAQPPRQAARGGFMSEDDENYYQQNMDALRVASREGGHKSIGEGSGRDDTIEALLSDGEYVMDAETVALLGDGSGDEGAKRLDEMRINLRKHKGRNLQKGKFSADAKRPEQYFAGGGKAEKMKEAAEELWELWNTRTGEKVGGPYKSKSRARRALDRKDNEYGAYAHTVRPAGDPPSNPVKKAQGGSVDEIFDAMMEEIA